MNTPLQQAVKAVIAEWEEHGFATDGQMKYLCKALEAEKAQAVEPVAWTLTETLDKRVTTTSGYLWFSDPVNCCWTPLYTHPAPPTTGGTEDKWRKLALQFDGQRMQAHAHLSAMILNPYAHMAEAMKFLAAPPTKAQQVAVPAGLALVPIEPTPEMIAAARDLVVHDTAYEGYRSVYKAMLTAAQGDKHEN